MEWGHWAIQSGFVGKKIFACNLYFLVNLLSLKCNLILTYCMIQRPLFVSLGDNFNISKHGRTFFILPLF